LKEPIEYTIITLLMILLLLATYNILSMMSPTAFKLEVESQALMDKITLTEGSPKNWDELLVLGPGEINDFGLSTGVFSCLDKDKVNLLVYRYLVSSSNLIENPFYVDPKDIQHVWIDLSERGFILDFIPLLNVSISVDVDGIRINVFTIEGENKTSDSSINVIVVSEVDSIVYLNLFEGNGFVSLSDTSNVKCVVAYVKLYSIVDIGYWVRGDDNYGFTVGGHLVSPVELNPNVHKLVQIYYNYTSISFFTNIIFSSRSADDVYVYDVSSTGDLTSHSDIDDNVVLFLAYENTTGLTALFFTYPCPIKTPSGFLGIVNLRYGGIEVPSQAALEYRILPIGISLYKVYLYLWRVER